MFVPTSSETEFLVYKPSLPVKGSAARSPRRGPPTHMTNTSWSDPQTPMPSSMEGQEGPQRAGAWARNHGHARTDTPAARVTGRLNYRASPTSATPNSESSPQAVDGHREQSDHAPYAKNLGSCGPPIVKKRIQSMVGAGDPVLSQVSFLSTETSETSVPTETTETSVPNRDKRHSTRASCLGDRYPPLISPNLASSPRTR